MPSWPKLSETAVLTVNGRDYKEWESVSVKHEWQGQPPYSCVFTCSEGMPLAKNFAVMQIKPGDECTVTLAGFPAFTGTVVTRQVYYDAGRHHIQIQAATYAELLTASVIYKGMEWKDKTFKEIAESILSPRGVNLVFEGGPPPDYRFPRISASHGESIVDFLDHVARGLGQYSDTGMSFTSNAQGDFVVLMGKSGGTDTVTEGKEIIIGREQIYNWGNAQSKPALTQDRGTDKKWGAAVAHSPFADLAGQSDFSGKQGPSTIFYGIPTSDNDLLKSRATTEQRWMDGDQITVTATVWGWLRPSGGLWMRNQVVRVVSPMLIMDGKDELRAKSVVFSQDNNTGTRTTLTLCNPAAGKTGPELR